MIPRQDLHIKYNLLSTDTLLIYHIIIKIHIHYILLLKVQAIREENLLLQIQINKIILIIQIHNQDQIHFQEIVH